MSKKILFIDPCCPKPYTNDTIKTTPMGGTEATVARVANGLHKRGYDVRVMQHNRFEVEGIFEPFTPVQDWQPHAVIVLRVASILPEARARFPLAKTFLWAHDLFSGPGEQLYKAFENITQSKSMVVAVSDFHRTNITEALRAVNFDRFVPMVKVYNPVVPGHVQSTVLNPNKVCFFSSPHKGLDLTLECFKQFKSFPELKDVQLHIANPGYYPNSDTAIPNVVNHGALPHPEVMNLVADSLCVMHLNNVFPETFGLVHAEANALGVPVLTSRMGANLEVLDHPQELIDVTDFKAVINRIQAWKTHGRPKVRMNPFFSIHKVLNEWEQLLK